jgi:hypothetical protein
MKKYEIQYFFGKDEQHLVETTQKYPRTLDEAFPQDAPNGNPFKTPLVDKLVIISLLLALVAIFVDVLVLRP